jgi:hypothetical protein
MPSASGGSIFHTFSELGWQKWPIVIFSVVSFVTTTAGIEAVIPERVMVSLAWAFASVCAFAIQGLMLGAALEIAREGVRLRWIFFYFAMAIPSMLFSYVSLYKIFAQDPIETRLHTHEQDEFNDYRQKTSEDLHRAISVVDQALAEVKERKKYEDVRGGTYNEGSLSGYLRWLKKQSNFNIGRDQSLPGQGPVFERWATIEAVLEKQQSSLSGAASQELLMKDVSAGTDLRQQAAKIETLVDRELLHNILVNAGYKDNTAGIPDDLKITEVKSSDRRTSELLVLSNAWNALRTRNEDPLIRWSIFWAVIFDALAFVLALASIKTASQAVIDQRVTELIADLGNLHPNARKAAFLVYQRIHSRGKLINRWFLDASAVREMSSLEQLVVSKLEQFGLIREQKFRKRLLVITEARNALRAVSSS